MPVLTVSAAPSCAPSGSVRGQITAGASSVNSGLDITITITGTATAYTDSVTIAGGVGSHFFTSVPNDDYEVAAVESGSLNTASRTCTVSCSTTSSTPPPACDLFVSDPEIVGQTVTFPLSTSYPPVSYSLDGGAFLLLETGNKISGVAFGSHSVTLQDANGCNFSTSIDVIDPSAEFADDFTPPDEGEVYRFYLKKAGVYTEILQPIDFDKVEIIIKRDADLHGFLKAEFSELKLEFDCQAGADLLRAAYEADGSDADVLFRVFRLSREDCQYKELYFGAIDFNNYTDTGDSVKANIRKRAFNDTFRTRRKTKVNLLTRTSLDETAIEAVSPRDIRLHGKGTSETYAASPTAYEYVTDEDSFFIPSGTGTTSRTSTRFLQFGLDNVATSEINYYYTYPTAFNTMEPAENFKAQFSGDYRISGRIKTRINIGTRNDRSGAFGDDVRVAGCDRGTGGAHDFKIVVIVKINGTENYLNVNEVSGCNLWGLGTGGIIDIPFNFNQKLNAGDKVVVFAWLTCFSGYEKSFTANSRLIIYYTADIYPETTLKIEAVTVAPDSISSGFYIHEAGAKLAAILTGKNDAFRSKYYGRKNSSPRKYSADGCGAFRYLLSGEALRRFPEPDFPLDWSSFAGSLQAIDGVGFGIESENGKDTIVAERLDYFYNPDHEVARFDYPEALEVEVASDYIFNEVSVGFKKWESEEANGRDEIAAKVSFVTPIKTADKKAEYLSDFIASGYLLEKTRRLEYSASGKQDDQNDKSIFIVKVSRTAATFPIHNFADNKTLRVALDVYESGIKTGDSFSILDTVNHGTYTVADARTVVLSGTTYTEIFIFETFFDYTATGGNARFDTVIRSEKNEDFDKISGVLSPETIYNADLAPAYSLGRLAPLLNSGLYFKDPAEKYRFASGEGNVAWISQRSSSAPCTVGDPDRLEIRHNQSRAIQDLDRGSMLFRPEIITFKTALSEAQATAILASYSPDNTTPAPERYGFIAVWNGINYLRGYLLEARLSEKDKSAKFTLIRAAATGDEGTGDTGGGEL